MAMAWMCGKLSSLLAMGVVGVSLNVGWLVLLVVSVLLVQVAHDVRLRLRRPELV